MLPPLNERLNWSVTSVAEVLAKFKTKDGQGRAKTDYLAYEEIASVIRERPLCRERARLVLNAITRATLGTHEGCAGLVKDEEMSTAVTTVLRIAP